MGFKRRVKKALNCLLGKTGEISSHKYFLEYSDSKSFEGKVVLVTGGTGAIGSAICYELAAMGAKVGICGRSKQKIESTIKMIEEGSRDVVKNLIPVVLDVNDDGQIESSIKDFSSSQGHIDVLINNAGGQPGRVGKHSGHLYEQAIDQIDLVLNTNLRGAILCSRVVCEIMANQKYGHIISMGSVIGMGGKAGYCEYAASKAGIIGFTKSLALEMAEYNVRINCISPGNINQVPFDEGSDNLYSKLNPMHRAGFTKEIADTVVFLMKNEFVNGQNIVVDGGRSIGLYGDINITKK